MWGHIYVYRRVYLRLILFIRITQKLRLTMERRCGQYSVTNCRYVGAMFPPSIFEDRCVDLRRWMIDVPTFEDRWSMCRPSKTVDRCEIIDTIVVCELRQGFALQCFHYNSGRARARIRAFDTLLIKIIRLRMRQPRDWRCSCVVCHAMGRKDESCRHFWWTTSAMLQLTLLK